jgi:hypothetical protein
VSKRKIIEIDPKKILVEYSGVRSVINDKDDYLKKLQVIQDEIVEALKDKDDDTRRP